MFYFYWSHRANDKQSMGLPLGKYNHYLERGLQLSCAVVLMSPCLFAFFAALPAAAAARHVPNYVAAAAGVAAALRPSVTKNTLNQIRNQAVAVKMRFSYK